MYLNFYIGLLRVSRDVTHPQWRLSMCLRAHEVWSRISRKPLEIEVGLGSKGPPTRSQVIARIAYHTTTQHLVISDCS